VALLHRTAPLPTDQRTRLNLAGGDGVLATAPLPDGRWAVATRRALYLLAEETVGRWPWSAVDHGHLDGESAVLEVRLVSGALLALPLSARTGRTFAATFHERVQSSVVHATEVPVPEIGRAHV
jgi:hypothetical protein